MKQFKLDTFDGKQISVDLWDDVVDVKGGVVISHGMSEHPDRYDDFAKKLNELGYVVIADDHRGHRYSSKGGIKGMVDGDSFNQTIEDMNMLVDYLKANYNVKVALFGHSYGSFLSQGYIEKYSKNIVGVVLSGTSHMKNGLLAAGRFIANLQKALLGPDKYGKIIDKMSFGAYNKPFLAQGQQFAWLSRDKEQVAKYEKDEYCGYVLSLGFYSSFFNAVMKLYGENALSIAKDFPILIACGSDDPVSAQTKNAKKLFDFYKSIGLENVKYKVYDGARHEILNETNRAEVYADMFAYIEGLFNN